MEAIIDAIRKSWSKETTYPGCVDIYDQEGKPSLGQCAVTTLLVQELLGGHIVGNKEYHHYWNLLEDGRELDLTCDQFAGAPEIKYDREVDRGYLLNTEAAVKARTKERYELLRKRFNENYPYPV